MKLRTEQLVTVALAAALIAYAAPEARATLITGPWMTANATPAQGDGPIHNANTDDPIVGDLVDDTGTNSNAADGEMLDSPFPAITLGGDGDKIILKGDVTIQGAVVSATTSGTPRTQYRFGLFNGDDVGDDLGWVGYYMSNKHGNAGTPAGTLGRKNVGNTTVYLSATGQTSLATQQGDGTAASQFQSATYSMLMTIMRMGADLQIDATLTGSNGFSQTMSFLDTSAGASGTYTFNHVGFLLGGNLDVDRAAFSNIRVSIPEPATWLGAILSLVAGVFARRRARG